MVSNSTLETVEIFHVDGVQVPEQHHQDGKTDRRLGRSHSQDEEDENLTGGIAQVMGERDEIHIHRQQHQLDCHQQNNNVLAVQEDADDGNSEQDCAKDQEVCER